MEDFFDDFDWEDMAMIGGMAEEFAEEKRDRRRRKQESFQDPEDEIDIDNDLRSRPPRPHYSKRRPRRKPFEQYAYEVAKGLKHHHDPLFGPAKPRRGPSRAPKNYHETTLYGVLVKNAHLVSEDFLKFVCTILYAHKDQEIDQLVFDPDGNPVVDDHEVFSTFDRGTCSITINLRRHFANAIRVAEHGYTGFSIHALIWVAMVNNVLHELKHALDAYDTGYMDRVPREEQERIADQWASEAKTFFARQGQTEMPELSAEPYFGPLVNKFIDRFTGNQMPEWLLAQQELINAGIFYRDKDAGIEIHTMQEFYEHSYRGLDGDEFGKRLNTCIELEQEREKKIWKQEEFSEMAIKEAIFTGRSMRIDYVDSEGLQFSQTLLPQTIFGKNYYYWVESIEEVSGKIITIRLDRIGMIEFL